MKHLSNTKKNEWNNELFVYVVFPFSDAEKIEENKEVESSYDMTSPVRSFLEKSKRQVENYIRDKLSLGEAKHVENESDLPNDPETILISHDKSTGTINAAVQDPNGNVYTFVKPQNALLPDELTGDEPKGMSITK